MASVFTHIIDGNLPGHFVYQDELAIAIMTIEPIRAGHVLVIPKQEIDHFDDLPESLAAHLMNVSQRVSKAIKKAFPAKRVGLFIAGLEVPHTHIHLVPMDSMSDLDLSRATPTDHQALAEAAKSIAANL
ncbi:HIT family protein [Thalassotalea aquiviva]|uniref:HIT family protein n=1 Tax=Thalassotalea aquiviva TaxID=3242415 RepID=UPI00352A3095